MNADPEFTVHLERGVATDLSAEAKRITNGDQRAKVLSRVLTENPDDEPAKAERIVPRWVADTPLVEFTIA